MGGGGHVLLCAVCCVGMQAVLSLQAPTAAASWLGASTQLEQPMGC